ncbi:MAG: hypothetical protein WD696_04935 [Bryobacteraceae bacterium]
MFELKSVSRNAIPEALAKAERYRLLSEPGEAESICLDVLRIDPDNQPALVMLLLAITDQFSESLRAHDARDVVRRLSGEYERAYYTGIILERSAKAIQRNGHPGYGFAAYEWLLEAMKCYEKAEAIRPAENDDAILRWNACARELARDSSLRPRPDSEPEPVLSE